MGLLDQLWDDTVAGPRPENGLGKLRKHSTFAFRSSSGKEVESDGGNLRSNSRDLSEEAKSVTRSIMIIKPRGNQAAVGNGSAPASPAGSTPPVSPFSGGSRESNRFRRRSTSDVYTERSSSSSPGGGAAAAAAVGDGPRSPPAPHDL